MAYTPPANPVSIDFNTPDYVPPVNPVRIDFDTEYVENLTRVSESAVIYTEQSASSPVFAAQAESLNLSDDTSAAFVLSVADNVVIQDAAIGVVVGEAVEPMAVVDNASVERFTFRVSSTLCAPVQAASPVSKALAIGLDKVGIGRHEVLSRFQQGRAMDIVVQAPLDVLELTYTPVRGDQQQGIPVTLPLCAPLEQLFLSYHRYCAPVDAADALSSTVHAPIAPSEFRYFETCADVDDTAYTYHVVYRTVYIDPLQPYSPSNDFLISPSSTVNPTTVIWHIYVPPVGGVDLDFSPSGYAPPAPAVDLDFGVMDLTDVPHVFNVYPDPDPAYAPSTHFVLPYTTQSYATREVEQIGLLRGKACAPLEDYLLTRDKRCAPVDKARKPPPGSSNIVIDPPRDPPPEPPIIYIIPERPVYMINHNFSTTLLDGTPVPLESVSLSLDADSFAWSFRGKLADKDAISLVQQPLNTDPVQLVITINGTVFKVIVERIDHTRQFSERQILLSGRSLTALLGQPYQLQMSATQASDLTVQQIAELQLPENWSINWDLPAWIVPNGAFSYTAQTPIQVLMGIANDIGAVIKPSRTAQTMTFQRRYRVGPWQFGQAFADLTVPEAAIGSLTLRPPIPIDINGVYVHGSDVGGIIGWCRLTGTDGAKLAQTVNNSLITDVDAARLLGERILAANQPQPAVQSFTLPMDNVDFPFVELGWLVQVTLDNVPIRGIVNAVSLEVSLGSVRQTIQLGEETPNNWSSFRGLLPRDPLLVGTLSVTDSVSSLVTLLDGGVIRVRGTGAVGGKYYVRAGRIENDAPNLNQVEIVI